MNKKLEIFIVDYNSSWLTNMALHTICKNLHSIDYHITVFDNSTKSPFQLNSRLTEKLDINVLDNTTSQIIDFESILKQPSIEIENNNAKNGSFKHALTIDFWLYNICTSSKVLILDNDILLKKEIDFINDDQYLVVSDIEKPWQQNGLYATYRFYPFIQYINAAKIKEKNIHYFDPERILHGKKNTKGNCRLYDTGGSFFEDVVIANIPFKRINYQDYIYHYGSGSWNTTSEKNNLWLKYYLAIMKQ